MEKIHRRLPGPILLLGLGMVLFALGAKLALIQRYGTDQPSADQWAAEGGDLLRGPLHDRVELSQLVAPHGEDRPALMRLWGRGLIAANAGQWDGFVELVANLLIYAAFLAVAWQWLGRLFEGIWLGVITAFMAVLFALPAAWENFLWGFQSGFLFMLLLGLLHISGTLGAGRPSTRWWLAQLAGLAGIFSLAAGAMSAAALVVMAGLELLHGRRKVWAWWTLSANVVLLGLALWLLPPGVASSGSRLAQLGAAVVRTGYLFSWPFPGLWWAFLLQTPWVILLVSWCRNSDRAQAAGDGRLVAIGAWVVCTAFAIAHGHEFAPATLDARTFDVLLLGLVINGLALAITAGRWTGWRQWGWTAGGLAWLLCVGWGLWNCNQPAKLGPLLEQQHALAVEQRQVVRDFLVSDNPAKLQEFANSSHRFPDFQLTLDLLRDPKVRPLLPPSLTADGHAGPWSRFTRHLADGWPLFLGAAVLCLMGGAVQLRGKEKKKEPAWYAT